MTTVLKNILSTVILAGFFAFPILTYAASPTLSFWANPQTIPVGEASALSWYSQNTYFCGISGGWSGSVPTSGTINVFPKETTNYSISCAGNDGVVSDTKTIFVNQNVATHNQPIVYSTPNPQPIPTPSYYQPPVIFTAACAASPTIVEVGKTVSFAAAQNGGYAPYSYVWSGDVAGTDQVRNLSFDTSGNKTARVLITDNRGMRAESSCTIAVTEKIIASVAPKPAPAPNPTPSKIVVAKSPTCKVVTICLDESGNIVPQTANGNKSGDRENKIETASNGNGKKFFLASLFGSGSNGNGSSAGSNRMKTLVIYVLPIMAALGVIALGYMVMRMGKKT